MNRKEYKKIPELKTRAHEDLTERARAGILMYFSVWMIIAIWSGIPDKTPLFFVINTILFFIAATLRLTHYRQVKKQYYSDIEQSYRFLVSLIMFSALHWGLMSAWVICSADYHEVRYPFMIILAAFAIGGTAVLNISRTISIMFPILVFSPTLISGLIFYDGVDALILFGLAVLSMIYIIEASKVSHYDYWDALYNHKLVQDRAIEMEHLSITDQLTGLNNRMYFNKKFNEEWQRCHRSEVPLSILLMDLDKFKNINDTYGHIVGDMCLKEVADTLKSGIKRLTDTLARYGGEEFAIILPDTDLEPSKDVAKKLVNAVREIEFSWEGKSIPITCSIGLAHTLPDESMERESIIKKADEALYQAKEQGRDRVILYKDSS